MSGSARARGCDPPAPLTWLLGFSGPRCEAEAIKRDIGTFLRDSSSWNCPRPRP